MSPQWESNSVAKIHEGCGGLVRWVEAYDDPHTGYTGQCVECGEERIVVERIVPVELPAGMIATDLVNDLRPKTRRELTWDHDADWEANQQRFQEVLTAL